MSEPTLALVWKQSRAHLNDVATTKYTNQVLLPFTQDALNELEDALLEIGSPVSGTNSAALSVPLNTSAIAYTGTTPALPADLIEPTEVYEKDSGADPSLYIPVTKMTKLPIRAASNVIGEWIWEEDKLKLSPCLIVRDIQIRYEKGFPILTDPADPTQILPFNEALPFLAFKTSAMAAELIAQNRDRATVLHEQAEVALGRALNAQVKFKQGTPTRRMGWRRNSRRVRSIYRTR